MSAERYKISECELDVLAITGPEGTYYIDGENIEARAIRQQARDIEQLRAELNRERETNAGLRRDLADPPPDIQELALKKCGHFEIVAKLRAELAAAVAERDRIKGDHDEAAHFARHFIRDDPNITPRGAIIRLGDKCTDLFVRLQQAEARLAAIDAAPVVAWQDKSWRQDLYHRRPDPAQVDTRELIAKPAKD